MSPRKLSIELPESAKSLNSVLKFLSKHGLISQAKAATLTKENTLRKTAGKSRWAKIAERFKKEAFLKGQGQEAKKLFRDFREGFNL